MNDAVHSISQSRHLRGLLFFLGLIGLVWELSLWIVSGSTQMLTISGLAVGVIIVTVSILNDWRSGFFVFIAWLLMEDLTRKFLGNGTALFFGKDVLAAVTYFSLVVARRRRQVEWFRPPFLVPLALFFGLALVQVFNTWTPNVIYGLLGLKLYFYYVPLMYVGYALMRTGRDLEKFLVFNVALGLFIAFLGVIQSVVGLSFLNPAVGAGAPELEELTNLTRYAPISGVATHAPSSVFVSAGRFASYMVLVTIMAMGAQGYLLLTRPRRAGYGFLGIGMAVVGAMQSASRGSIMYTLISILVLSAGFFWGAPWKWGQGRRLVKAVRRALFVGAAGLFLMVQLFPASIGANWSFYSETLDPNSSASELRVRTLDYPLANLLAAFEHPRWPIGYGTGTASLGMQYIARLVNQRAQTIEVENGFGTLIVEMGILGPLLWILWTATLLFYAWKIVRQLRQTAYFPIALAIFWYAFLLLYPFTYQAIDAYENFVMNAYFWLLIGVLFRLPHLARTYEFVPEQSSGRGLATLPAYAGGR